MNRDLYQLFRTQLDTLAQPQPGKQTEFWRHRLMDMRCVFCGCELVRHKHRPSKPKVAVLHVEHLVPRKHGGCHEDINLVPSCAACNASKRNYDWLDWRQAPSEAEAQALDARRLQALAWSDNHLLRNPNLGKRKDTVERHLAARWAHPRCRVFAALTDEVGLVGWERMAWPTPDVLGILSAHGARVAFASHTIALPPDRFHDAIWALIDHNALVHRVDLHGHPDPTADAPGDAQWHATFSSVLDVKRRRPKRKPIRLSALERPMDWGQRLLIELHGNWVPTGKFDWDWVNKHKETDCAWARKERERLAREERELKTALAAMPPPFTVEYVFQEAERRLAKPGPEDTLTRLAREYLPAAEQRTDIPHSDPSDPACCPG